MTRFIRSGMNWEPRAWAVTGAVDSLCDEIEAYYPEPREEDGTVASKTHDENNQFSDHRPTPYTGPGKVRAVDIGVEGSEGVKISEALRASKDKRLRYVIHNGLIFTSYSMPTRKAWEWGVYEGSDPHLHHIHCSFQSAYDSTTGPWDLNLESMSFLPLKQGDKNPDVGLLQRLLNDAYKAGLKIDDTYGPTTAAVVKQNLYTGPGDGTTVSDFHWRKLMLDWTDWRISIKGKPGPQGEPGEPGLVSVKVNNKAVFP